jgi:hypothetical protein
MDPAVVGVSALLVAVSVALFVSLALGRRRRAT